MKIGILTFEKAVNYGTALQAIAMQRVLESFGVQAEFLAHRCDAIDANSKVFDLKEAKSPAYVVAHLYNLSCAMKRNRAFREFQQKFFAFGTDKPRDYDMIVAGSDQIWNYKLTGNDWFYFLDFPKENIKKVAYAGSFGLPEVAAEYVDTLKPLLEDFDYLSVREETAARIIREITGRDVPVVLDPTLLLNREQWAAMTEPDSGKTGYIFVYTVFASESLWQFAYELSKRTGLPIRTISYSKLHRHQAEYDFSAGPGQWLSHMLGADYVVTNSFHGMAFSVNFQKQFYYELPPKTSGVGSRLQDMAQKFGLTDRELSRRSEAVIDYTGVNAKLEQARTESRRFVEQFISK